MRSLKLVKHTVLYKDEQYNAFPSIVRSRVGTYIMGFRQAPSRASTYGGRTHVDPSSKAVFITSPDGLNWSSQARILYDDYFFGVQDPCLHVLRDGSLFATMFMWKVAELEDVKDQSGYRHTIFGRWASKPVGSYSIRSADGGDTWDQPIPIGIANSFIRGNSVEMEDGTILTPLYGGESDEGGEGSEGGHVSDVIIGRTEDRGASWSKLAVIPAAEGYLFHEPNLFKTDSGKLVLFIRSVKKTVEPGEKYTASPLFTSESSDEGQTWSLPAMHRIYSPSPFHLLRLNDGSVLLTYGYRCPPFGIRALVLDAECGNLDRAEEVVIRDDGLGEDIGYTSSAQISDDQVLITYYYYNKDDGYRYIAGSVCELR